MENYFDKRINRRNTNSFKWDHCKSIFNKSDIIPLWVADMDFQSPPEVINSIIERASHGIFGYTAVSENLNNAFINWEKKRNNLSIEKDWIVHCPGVVSALNTAIQTFTKKEDKILVQTPVYHPFFSSIKENNRLLIKESLIMDNQKVYINFEDLENQLKNDVKMMILCNPHNPIGRIWSKEELSKIIRLCEKYNIILVSDEIHSDLVFKPNKHIPALNLAKNKKNIISLFSPTKTFNIAGLSESLTVIPDKKMKSLFIKTMYRNGSNMLNIFGITAAEAAYSHGNKWLENLLLYLEKNLTLLTDFFERNIPQIKVIKPDATYLAWLNCNNLKVEKNKLNTFFVENANIGLNDGKMFGSEGYGFQRLNFACRRELLVESLENIKFAVNKL